MLILGADTDDLTSINSLWLSIEESPDEEQGKGSVSG